MKTDTICAISTPAGTGAISVIRVSGEDAITISDKIFRSAKSGKNLASSQSHRAYFGHIINKDEEVVDEVLVTVFVNPYSFTGENSMEIACHGSQYIQQQILQLLIENGCRLGLPGEFTQRAFLNGKLDLSQAEAVADLIAANSAASHRMALNQMKGSFSNELMKLREKLLKFVSLIELELDFNEEDVEFVSRPELKALAQNIEETIAKLSNSFRLGNVLKNGIPVALVGETNVGKSTLLNVLLNEEKAIVSDIHGTTRDVIEDLVNIEGITFRFIDTAGIRDTKDKIEKLGIERTFQKIEQASIVLWLIDCTQFSERIEWLTEAIMKRAKGKKIILVFNKIDKIAEDEREVLNELFECFEGERIYISAKKKINTRELQNALIKAAQIPELQTGDVVVSNMRHYEALEKALDAVRRVIAGLDAGISNDFVSQDIREVIFHLGTITGSISTDEILGSIFSQFCMGK